jgi:hypothetical protein
MIKVNSIKAGQVAHLPVVALKVALTLHVPGKKPADKPISLLSALKLLI